MFLPIGALALSLASPTALNGAALTHASAAAAAAALFATQELAPRALPPALRSWAFLPASLRSLEHVDRLFGCCGRWLRCCCCCGRRCCSSAAERLIHDDPASAMHDPFELHPDPPELRATARPHAAHDKLAGSRQATRQMTRHNALATAATAVTASIAEEGMAMRQHHPPPHQCHAGAPSTPHSGTAHSSAHYSAHSTLYSSPYAATPHSTPPGHTLAVDGTAYAQQRGPSRSMPGPEGGPRGGFKPRRSGEQFARLEEEVEV